MSGVEAKLNESSKSKAIKPPEDWREWLTTLFPNTFKAEFGQRHIEFWQHIESIDETGKPPAFFAVWPRGGGKTTTAETAAVRLGAKGTRKFILYVRSTQDKANESVQNIAALLESKGIAQYEEYELLTERKIGKYGNAKGWRVDTLRCANDFSVVALGFDAAVRGIKIEDYRPDVIFLDDIDDKNDSEDAVRKKIATLTKDILPAGSTNVAIIAMQNLIHSGGIIYQVVKGIADFLYDRVISGPYPAIEGLKYEVKEEGGFRIVAGDPTWEEGQSRETCEAQMNEWGLRAFLEEAQHEVDGDHEDALMSADDFDRTRVTSYPDLARVAIAVDPPGGSTECGIVAGGKAYIRRKIGNEGDWHGYVLEDATMPKGVKPEAWALAVLKCYYRHKADVIFIERNYGGDMVSSTIRQTKWMDDDGKVIVDGSKVKLKEVTATRGKLVRAEPVATVYQQGRGHQVGHFPELEKEWRTYVPGESESPNRLDAMVWLYAGLDLIDTNMTDEELLAEFEWR